jgi:hypothetical protein
MGGDCHNLSCTSVGREKMKWIREVWPLSLVAGILFFLIGWRALEINWLKEVIAAYVFWNIAWIYFHVVLGRTKQKWEEGVFGFACITFVCIVTQQYSTIVNLYCGFIIASCVMLIRKWDDLERYLSDSPLIPVQAIGLICLFPKIFWEESNRTDVS